MHADFATAIRAMTRKGRVFQPDPGASRIYEQLYQRVYLKMYKRLQPMYAEIADITGYPERC
jgi:ribulose kinase